MKAGGREREKGGTRVEEDEEGTDRGWDVRRGQYRGWRDQRMDRAESETGTGHRRGGGGKWESGLTRETVHALPPCSSKYTPHSDALGPPPSAGSASPPGSRCISSTSWI